MVLRFVPVSDPYELEKYPPKKNGYIRSQFPPNIKWTFSTEAGLPGFDNQKTSFTTNSLGYRGREFSPGEYRIFAVGGSTTECLYVDDSLQWPHLLEEKLNKDGLNVNVQNAGKSGDAIDDHIAMIGHKIVHLDPDLILVYMGVNDVLRLVCNDNPLKFDRPGNKIPVFRHCLSELQLYRRLHNVVSQNKHKQNIAFDSDYGDKSAYVRTFPLSDSIPVIDTAFFKKKMDVLLGICQSATEAKVVFVPQLTAWRTEDEALKKWQWLTEICGIRYKPEVLAGVMDQVNDMIVEECRKKGVTVVEPYLEPASDYFYDDCHFNPNGCQAFAELLFDSLQEQVFNPEESISGHGKNNQSAENF